MARAALLLLCFSYLLGCVGALRSAEGGTEAAAARLTIRDINGIRILAPQDQETPSDPSVIQAVYVACGESACGLSMEAITSFLAQALLDGGKKPVLHLFVDGPCAERLQKFPAYRPRLVEAAEIKIYNVSDLSASTALNLYKACASLRLSLPRLLPHLPKVLYMDIDTYVVGSLRRLWDVEPRLWALGENDRTWYVDRNGARCPKDWHRYLPEGSAEVERCYYGMTGLNSGVLLVNQSKWRELDLDKEVSYWVDSLTNHGENPKVFMMGDQDIFNILAAVHKKDNYTTVLPCEMNSIYNNRFMCYYGTGDWESFSRAYPRDPANSSDLLSLNLARNTRQPVIIHGKFTVSRLGEHRWTDLHNKLRLAVERVSRGEVGGAKSICEVAECVMS